MKRRFVVGLDSFTKEQHEEFKNKIDGPGIYWWHWIDGMWLITTDNDEITTGKIIEQIRTVNEKSRAVVFEFPEDVTWTTTVHKNASGKKISDWLKSKWAEN